MGTLFGTDGIRGLANQEPITPETGYRLGRAIVQYCTGARQPPRIVLGRDTRSSGEILEDAVVSGIVSAGGNACRAGVIPTPGVAYLTRSLGAGGGIVVSASHNPYEYNGFKVFSHDGFKLSEQEESLLERMILAQGTVASAKGSSGTDTVLDGQEAIERYGGFLRTCFPEPWGLEKLTVVLDCANGATARVAPKVFEALDADVTPLFVTPDGRNINLDCGSQHTETLQEKVQEIGADAGLAFDGDGDRLIAVDEKGRTLSGDQILAICAKMMKEKGELDNSIVVSTVMSNIGLKIALEALGIRHVATRVGDRHVAEEMQSRRACLGGEESGHLIFLKHQTTGDGILSALQLLAALRYFNQSLSELSTLMRVFPQARVSVPVRAKPSIAEVPRLARLIREVETRLGDHGRVLVRYSGTEPVCRVMVEGPTAEEAETHAQRIADQVKMHLGQ